MDLGNNQFTENTLEAEMWRLYSFYGENRGLVIEMKRTARIQIRQYELKRRGHRGQGDSGALPCHSNHHNSPRRIDAPSR